MKSGKRSEPLAKVGIARRSFLKHGVAAGVATAVPFPFVNLRYSLSTPEPIRVGVVGCGGRGTGAALNVLQAKTKVIYPPPRKGYHTENAVPGAKAMAENVEVIALADLFRTRGTGPLTGSGAGTHFAAQDLVHIGLVFPAP